MQLEQQETFELHGPQLEVFGEVESALPAPVRKRPAAAGVLAAAVLVAVLGIGGVKLNAQHNEIQRSYAAVNEYGHGLQTDLNTQVDAAANLVRLAERGLVEADSPALADTKQALADWDNADDTPAAQYACNTALYRAADALYNEAARSTADRELLLRAEDLYNEIVSAQATIDRAAGAYNEQAADYNRMAGQFPASLIGTLWNTGEAQPFAPTDNGR